MANPSPSQRRQRSVAFCRIFSDDSRRAEPARLQTSSLIRGLAASGIYGDRRRPPGSGGDLRARHRTAGVRSLRVVSSRGWSGALQPDHVRSGTAPRHADRGRHPPRFHAAVEGRTRVGRLRWPAPSERARDSTHSAVGRGGNAGRRSARSAAPAHVAGWMAARHARSHRHARGPVQAARNVNRRLSNLRHPTADRCDAFRARYRVSKRRPHGSSMPQIPRPGTTG